MMKFETRSLEKHSDKRGYLVELLKTKHLSNKIFGQMFFATNKPGRTRGNHYHTRKTEWFYVIKGTAKLVLKDIENGTSKELILSEKRSLIVKVPPKVAHGIKNIGDDEMIFIAYVDETLNKRDPDTIYEKVIE